MTPESIASDQFFTLIHKNADGMLVVDEQGIMQFVNPAAEVLLGRSGKDLVGEPLGFPLMTDEKVEIDVQSHTQNSLVAELRTVKIVWDQQPAFLISLRDITERKALEMDLKARSDALQSAVSELEVFSHMVSHDLWNQMRRIGQLNQALLQGEQSTMSAQGKAQVQQIQTISEQTRASIEGLLQFSRVSQMEMACSWLRIHDLVKELTEQLQLVYGYRALTMSKLSGTRVYVDKRLLRVALDNLLENAWKYTKIQETPEIEFSHLSASQQPASMPEMAKQLNYGLFMIQDNGIGFNMADIDDLFRPFRRLPSAKAFEGNGIGLATVQRIIHRHGGHIWAESIPSAGSIFYFTLPLQS
ncbi:MAG: ATP-binding protein [Cyanobacteria bacterium P01_B01_bin.77]